jgi:acyl-CoA thioester hydrolase
MTRVKIQLPAKKLFSTTLSIRVSDINYGGHLGNDTVVSLIHEARYRMFNEWGYKSDLEIDGFGTIQLDTAVQYKGEGFHGDQVVVTIYAGGIGSRTFDLFYELKTAEKLIALGKTGLGIYDYDAKKLVSIPEPFLQKLQG